jgi:acetoin utilization protein AcuB
MLVRSVMSPRVAMIDRGATCQEALARMHGSRIRHLPVVDRDDRLVGIVTDRDLRHRLFTPGVFRQVGAVPVTALLGGVPVSEVMSSPVVTVGPDDDLEKAATLMREDKVGSLPVTEAGRVVGIVTETDLLRHIVQADASAGPEVEIIVSYP